MKKVLVGTMYSGEGDFEKCCQSIKNQTYPCEQYVITGLQEIEAHKKLSQVL